MERRIPLSSAEIPAGTGLVQQVECKGIDHNEDGKRIPALDEVVVAEVSTFANGIRRVCCLHAERDMGSIYCNAGESSTAQCIYVWENPKK